MPGSKDIYIAFDDDLYYKKLIATSENWVDGYEGEHNGDIEYWAKYEKIVIGSFLHIKEDGSYTTIYKRPNYNSYIDTISYDEPVLFDAAGNLYYYVSGNDGGASQSAIYKYNPATGTATPVTFTMGNSKYSKVAVSADGAYIYSYMWHYDNQSTSLRIIPTANPDMVQIIANDVGGFTDFFLNPQTKELYISGNIQPVNSSTMYSGFFKGKIPDTNPDHWEWTQLFSNDIHRVDLYGGGYGVIVKRGSIYYAETGKSEYTYAWNQRYYKPDGTVDYAAIMRYLYDSLGSDYIEFRYGGKKDLEALALLDKSKLEELYNQYIIDSATGLRIDNGDNKFIHDFLFRTDTGEQVVLDRPYYGYSGDIRDPVFASDGSIWGFITIWDFYSQSNLTGTSICSKLIDANGKRDIVLTPLPEQWGNGIRMMPVDSFLYYRAHVKSDDTTSIEHIYRFRISSPQTLEDMFDCIISRDSNTIAVRYYAVGGDSLYFGGTDGVSFMDAKINTTTGAYTELDFGESRAYLTLIY
jgi:hypothetical protein